MPHFERYHVAVYRLVADEDYPFFAVQCAVARHENPAVAGLYCVGHDYDAFASAFAEILYRLRFGHACVATIVFLAKTKTLPF